MSNKLLLSSALVAAAVAFAPGADVSASDCFPKFFMGVSGDWGFLLPKPSMNVTYDKGLAINNDNAAFTNTTPIAVDLGESKDRAKYKYPGIAGSLGVYFNDYLALHLDIGFQGKTQSVVALKGANGGPSGGLTMIFDEYKAGGTDYVSASSNTQTPDSMTTADAAVAKLSFNPSAKLYPAVSATDNITMDMQKLNYSIGAHVKLLPDSIINPYIGVNMGLLQRKATLSSTNYNLAFPTQATADKITSKSITLNNVYDFAGGAAMGAYVKLGDSGVSLKVGYSLQYEPGFKVKDSDIFAIADDAVIAVKYTSNTGNADTNRATTYASETMKNGLARKNIFQLSALQDKSSDHLIHKFNVGFEVEL